MSENRETLGSGMSKLRFMDLDQGSRDVEGAGHGVRPANLHRKVVDAPSEERLDVFNDLERQAPSFSAQHPGQVHVPVPLDSTAEHHTVALQSHRLHSHHAAERQGQKSLAISTGDSHSCPYRKMVANARALDADFGRKVTQTETPIARPTNASFCELH